LRQGKYGEATAILERAVALAPRDPQMRFHLGMAQLGAGQRDLARSSLEAALALGAAFDGADEARATLAKLP
jgi:Flp pilus assembly protein TadD